MTMYTTIESPLGALLLVGEETPAGVALASVSVPGQKGAPTVEPGWRRDPAAFEKIENQIRAYFDGTIKRFDIDLTTRGTPFQRRVWAVLGEIPYGRTITYGELAERVGAPRDRIRAVAAAVGANPWLVVRPCHRVIGADGSLTGFAAGVERKRELLTHEGALQPQLI
jgi:methylated-DNA-[protein]-cysteine S-methyltransferase